MPKGFSEKEKINIREMMIANCKISWAKYGYKKTSIDDLCKKSGISKGAFYVFFQSKEQLFYETLKTVQNNLYLQMEHILLAEQNKLGVAKALTAVYKEYVAAPFLYDTSSEDFMGFMNKLSDEEKADIFFDSLAGAKRMIHKPFLSLRISEDKALSVLSSLLNLASHKDELLYDHFEVFGFMLENLIEKIFE